MSDLVVLCPTRGRPQAAREAHEAFVSTKRLDSTAILFVVDDDDPQLDAYLALDVPTLHLPPPGNMATALNEGVKWAIETLGPRYVGFIGDDHRFRTENWDGHFTDVLYDRGGGMVYGNDLVRPDGDIPTQIVMSTEIVTTLGWMALPGAKHLYLDNTWRVLGDEVGCLYYMPDVIIEHMHPSVGKADWDESYRRVNAGEVYQHDALKFSEWIESGAAKEDVARVKEVLGR